MNDSPPAQLCTFRVGTSLYGLDARSVQEVLAPQPLTPVPKAPDYVAGLINLRGTIVAALDLGRRLGNPQTHDASACSGVIVKTSGHLVSLLVDDLGEVFRTTSSRFDDPPSSGASEGYITAIYKLDHDLVAVLDDKRIAEVGRKVQEQP